MRAVIQRVIQASISIDNIVYSSISNGMVVLLGIEEADSDEDIIWLIKKIINLRIFNDANDLLNLSVRDTKGQILVVSQFTLHASVKKGNRPSFIKSAKPEIAISIYERFVLNLKESGLQIETGKFGTNMTMSLINDGPVTLIIDTKSRE